MAYINIAGTDTIGDSLTSINTNAQNFDNRITSLESNRTSIVNSLNTISAEVFNANSIVQIVTNTQVLSEVKSTGTNTVFTYQNPTATSITAVTLNRTTNTSKILIELTGGITNLLSDRFLYTYFYVSLNNAQYQNPFGTNPVEVKFRSGGGAVREPHYAKGVFTPNTSYTTGTPIAVQVWAKLSARDNWWHDPVAQVPFTLTMTEIL